MEGGKATVIANAEGERTTPSVVAYTKNGERLVGTVAKRQAITNHENTVISIKREMGTDYKVKLNGKEYSPQEISSMVLAKLKKDAEAYLGEKVTELGAFEIVAFPSARCISRPDEKSLAKKVERWQKIAASAAEQSGRGRIPEVIVLDSFKNALARGATSDMPIVFYENEHATTLRQALSSKEYKTVSILSGPEGGLEEAEIQAAREAGFRICTLGNRILRCETAPLCGLSAVMYDAGEF